MNQPIPTNTAIIITAPIIIIAIMIVITHVTSLHSPTGIDST